MKNLNSTEFKMGLGRKGFSLIQTLVTTAIGIIGATAVIQLALNSERLNKHNETMSKLGDFSTELRMIMSREDICRTSLLNAGALASVSFPTTGLDTQEIVVNEIWVGLPTPTQKLAKDEEPVPNIENIRITDMRIKNLINISPSGFPDTQFSARLWIQFEKTGFSIGPQTLIRKYPIFLKATTTSGTAQITGCSLGNSEFGEADLATICSSSGGQYIGGICKYPTRTPASTADCMASLGEAYIWDGNSCVLSGGGASLPATPCQARAMTCSDVSAVSYFGPTCTPGALAAFSPSPSFPIANHGGTVRIVFSWNYITCTVTAQCISGFWTMAHGSCSDGSPQGGSGP